jgi:hypothetical protein
MKSRRTIAVALLVALAVPLSGKVKIETRRDKSFNFKTVRTYAWHPSGAGDVKILQADGDDPAKIRAQFEPTIVQAAERALAARGLTPAPGENADVYVYYYLLIGAASSSQYLGQFIGSAPEWGFPPFAGGTTSLEIYEQGSLVLDVSSRAGKSVIWRGIARTEIDRQRTQATRIERVQGAVGQMLEKFPKVK